MSTHTTHKLKGARAMTTQERDVAALQAIAELFELLGKVFDSKTNLRNLSKTAVLRNSYFNMCNYQAMLLREIAQRQVEGK